MFAACKRRQKNPTAWDFPAAHKKTYDLFMKCKSLSSTQRSVLGKQMLHIKFRCSFRLFHIALPHPVCLREVRVNVCMCVYWQARMVWRERIKKLHFITLSLKWIIRVYVHFTASSYYTAYNYLIVFCLVPLLLFLIFIIFTTDSNFSSSLTSLFKIFCLIFLKNLLKLSFLNYLKY